MLPLLQTWIFLSNRKIYIKHEFEWFWGHNRLEIICKLRKKGGFNNTYIIKYTIFEKMRWRFCCFSVCSLFSFYFICFVYFRFSCFSFLIVKTSFCVVFLILWFWRHIRSKMDQIKSFSENILKFCFASIILFLIFYLQYLLYYASVLGNYFNFIFCIYFSLIIFYV